MIRNYEELEKFEKKLIENEKPDVIKNFKIVSALYKEARALGVFPLKDPLEGIEVDIRIAEVINSVSNCNSNKS